MKNILTLNKIAVCGLDRFDKAAYVVGDSVADPQGIMVRSAAMHDMELPASLLAIARAGAVPTTFRWTNAAMPASWCSTPPVPMPMR